MTALEFGFRIDNLTSSLKPYALKLTKDGEDANHAKTIAACSDDDVERMMPAPFRAPTTNAHENVKKRKKAHAIPLSAVADTFHHVIDDLPADLDVSMAALIVEFDPVDAMSTHQSCDEPSSFKLTDYDGDFTKMADELWKTRKELARRGEGVTEARCVNLLLKALIHSA